MTWVERLEILKWQVAKIIKRAELASHTISQRQIAQITAARCAVLSLKVLISSSILPFQTCGIDMSCRSGTNARISCRG